MNNLKSIGILIDHQKMMEGTFILETYLSDDSSSSIDIPQNERDSTEQEKLVEVPEAYSQVCQIRPDCFKRANTHFHCRDPDCNHSYQTRKAERKHYVKKHLKLTKSPKANRLPIPLTPIPKERQKTLKQLHFHSYIPNKIA